ncbi:MAG: BBE domain-containing protein [Actinomycetota bacterium]|nr:BBE domain-containing protein [Actinomycetota bacterium]
MIYVRPWSNSGELEPSLRVAERHPAHCRASATSDDPDSLRCFGDDNSIVYDPCWPRDGSDSAACPDSPWEQVATVLETTRQFARQRLDEVTLARLRERHARRYRTQAQEAELHLFRAGSAQWLPRLHSEQDNFRAALEWSFGPDGDPELGAQLVRCLWHPWDLRGARGEGLHWVHAGLDAIGTDRPAQRLPLLSAGALFHLGRADFDAVAVLAHEQLALARPSGAQDWVSDALAMTASVAWARGDFAQAHQLYEEAVAASLAGGDLWRASMEEAQLARLHRDRQELATARAVAMRALAHAREVGEDLAYGLVLDVLASLEQRRDDVPAARRLAQDALAHYRRVGYVEGEASALHLAGRLALAAHEPEPAREAFERSLHLCRRIEHRAGTATALEGLAGVAAMVDDNEHAVLLLGGGGNFGVVTSFTYRLHPVGPVLAGGLSYPWTRIQESLRFHHEFMAAAPDELSTHVSLALDPAGEPVVTVAVCYCGSHEEGERVLRPLRAFGPPVADTIGAVPYLAWQSAPDAGWPSGRQHYWKAGWLRHLTDAAIETMALHVPRIPSATSGVGLQRMGGAASRVAASATAFAQRAEQYDFLIASQWPDPRHSAQNLEWTQAFFAAMQPHLESAAYVNNLGAEGQERVRAAYGDNYPRLAALKQTYDPANVFRLNQNIATATPQAERTMTS